MLQKSIPLWKEAPFIRYIGPFIAGILMQRQLLMPPVLLSVTAGLCWLFLLSFNFFRLPTLYGRYFQAGVSALLLLFFLGTLAVYLHNIQRSRHWIGYHLEEATALVLTIEEPPQEKTKSYKAEARLSRLATKDSVKTVSGRVILYFQKDQAAAGIRYGSRILIRNQLKPIADFESPTGFSYRNYCALRNIYHQQYLKANAYRLLPGEEASFLMRRLLALRQATIHTLRTYIKGSREAGLAEALLIGYKNDLDKSLVQSYANTGVVHIIAISGLHVGLIYTILSWIIAPFMRWQYVKKLQPVLLLAGLWIFSLAAGGSASVLRSAVMFSFIVTGKSIRRNSSVYNSLAASAFLLLCYNPFWLWDIGFQLSYLAVLSIVIFRKPIYDLLYVQNKLMDTLWKMTAITLSAQLLTTPLCLYYFHQFPNIFLVANSMAVPLSSLILAGELLLCVASVLPSAALFLGGVVEWLIRLLNNLMLHLEKIPFAVTHGVEISAAQAILLFLILIVAGALWKDRRNPAR